MSDQTPLNDEDTQQFDQWQDETSTRAKILTYPQQVVDEVAKIDFPDRKQWFNSWIGVTAFAVTGAVVLAGIDWAVAQLLLAIN